MDLNLSGRRALVCGSTQGIGKAVAIELALAGADVILIARNQAELEKVKNELSVSVKQKHFFLVADFAQPDKLKDTVEKFIRENSSIDILINNTGGPKAGPVNAAGTEEFESAFKQHLICNHVLMQCCVNGMKEKKFGRIINIISTSVKQPLRGLGVSNTIRAAVANWSKTLSAELAPFGITVNNVLPGATATKRLQEIISNKSQKTSVDEKEITKEMLAEIPSGRFAQPSEIANAVVFLSSPAASYITGINLPVDGGRTLCL
jgi:3-oxoacyl-[acyl-carrier protein] reductase